MERQCKSNNLPKIGETANTFVAIANALDISVDALLIDVVTLLTAKANVDRVLKMEVEQDVEKEKDHGQR